MTTDGTTMRTQRPFRRTLIPAAALVFALAATWLSLPASAASLQDLVGRWFTEINENDTFDGEPYDMRRQIEDNRPDGTKSVIFRFYKNCKYIGELINTHDWGVENNRYWARCTSIMTRGEKYPCFQLQEHDLLSVGPNELSYKSRDSGQVYNHTRIPPDFKLPTSSCVGILRSPPVRGNG